MKQKLPALILATTMTLILFACGSNQFMPATDNAPPVSNFESGSSDDNPIESDMIEPVTENRRQENSQNSTSQESSSAADPDMRPPNPPQTEPAKPESLIIMTTSSNGYTGTKDIVISSIAPYTGDTQAISQFTFGYIRNGNTFLGTRATPEESGTIPGIGYYATRREWFDDDFDCMAVSWTDNTSTVLIKFLIYSLPTKVRIYQDFQKYYDVRNLLFDVLV